MDKYCSKEVKPLIHNYSVAHLIELLIYNRIPVVILSEWWMSLKEWDMGRTCCGTWCKDGKQL